MSAASPPAGGRRCNASDKRERRRTQNTAASSKSADPSRRYGAGTCLARAAVRLEPTMPPSVAPAAMKPNSRFPCSALKTSTINPQKTDTTKRLKTDAHMKNTRPIQILDRKSDGEGKGVDLGRSHDRKAKK